MESSELGILLKKLKDAHPMVQRYAVRSLFDLLKVEISSKAAQRALAECMVDASHSLPALDEACFQLCALVGQAQAPKKQEEALTALILTHLQAALECAPAQAVPSIIMSIGFICRNILCNHTNTLLCFQSCELHPFVKAFKSRKEAHLEILQQVLFVLTEDKLLKDPDTLQFLQPFFNFVFLQPVAHNENLVAARELYFSLASLISLNILMGTTLTRLLIHYMYHFASRTIEEANWKFLTLREAMDAVESLVMQASMKKEVDNCKEIVLDIQVLLVDMCYELKKHGLSMLPALELLGRIVKLQKGLETSLFWRQKILCLAHLLAMSDMKDEQMALIRLASKVLRKTNQEGMELLIDSTLALPTALLWILPLANIIASSCTSLKDNASRLLQDLEDLLAHYWTQRETNISMPPLDVCVTATYGQFTDNLHRILMYFWFDIDCKKSWAMVDSIAEWKDCKDHDVELWLSRLCSCVGENSQRDYKVPDVSSKARPSSNFSSLVWMLASVMLIHPVHSNGVLKFISRIGKDEPANSFSIIPVVLFYLRTWKRQLRRGNTGILLRLLKVLPSLAMHPMSLSIIAGTLQSLLQSNRLLAGMAIRLLCKTWEIADRVYPELEVLLNHSHFLEHDTDFDLTLSRAASLSDVCRRDADRGVGLVLSVQACIESENVTLQAFGLQSLSWLCQHDVIDFYTAWDVLCKLFDDFPTNLALAESLCDFLQNGALDAAAHIEISPAILQLLWEGATIFVSNKTVWWKVREKALMALSCYEVEDLNRSLEDARGKHIQILQNEENADVLRACEKLVVKYLWHEFKSKPRGQERVKHADSNLQNFFATIPQLFFRSVARKAFIMQSPAAFLLLGCYKEGTRVNTNSNAKSGLQAWESEFEEQFSELANNMNLQGNLILALLNLDPWYSFISDQIKERSNDNTLALPFSAIVSQLLKVLRKLAEEAIPRVAENAILALAVLYRQVARTEFARSVDSVVSFLKSCLAQNHHEYMQWTSAVALGYVGQHCNPVDWRLRLDISTRLLERFCASDRDVIRGACSLALGFILHNLFTQNDAECNLRIDAAGMVDQRELNLFALIFQNLIHNLSIWCPEMMELLQKCKTYPMELGITSGLENILVPQTIDSFDVESMWTIAGLAMAFGSSVVAFERVGALESLAYITHCLMQGIQSKPGNGYLSALALGSFLALPMCIRSCLRLRLLTEHQVDNLLQDVKNFFELTKCTQSCVAAELKMAACMGSGNLLATILSAGSQKVPLEYIQWLIESMKFIAMDDSSVLSSLGGYMGLANALGAGAALMVPLQNCSLDELNCLPEMVETSCICTPLLYDSGWKEDLQKLTQFLLDSSRQGLHDNMSNAWWALALIRKAFLNITSDPSVPGSGDTKFLRTNLRSLPKDSTLFGLCWWLLNIGKRPASSPFPFHTVASVLRCLKGAPQLPYLDWRMVLRQIMHEAGSSEGHHDGVGVGDEVCRECILLSLAHMHKLPILQTFLDDLCDLSGLLSARASVNSILMLHMTELRAIFSGSRMDKFFLDSVEVMCRASKSWGSNSAANASWQLKMSFWKGLKSLLLQPTESLPHHGIDMDKLLAGVQKCYHLLDVPLKESENGHLWFEEWSDALECMGQASQEWIMKVTEFDSEAFVVPEEALASAQKAIFTTSQMVARHILSPAALIRSRRWLCNQDVSLQPEVLQQLLWITWALKDVGVEEKQHWLLETVEIAASGSNHPDTALLLLALLVSSWCPYSPLLLVDVHTPTQLLPFTLPLLLSQESWSSASKCVLQKCMALLNSRAEPVACGSALWYLKRACIVLRNELPFADQLRLADDFQATGQGSRLSEDSCIGDGN